MYTTSRIPQIIDHERAIARSLTPFALSLASFVVTFIVLVGRG